MFERVRVDGVQAAWAWNQSTYEKHWRQIARAAVELEWEAPRLATDVGAAITDAAVVLIRQAAIASKLNTTDAVAARIEARSALQVLFDEHKVPSLFNRQLNASMILDLLEGTW